MVARDASVTVFSEVYADRGYQHNGQLVARSEPGSMIHDPNEATERLLSFLQTGQMPVVGSGSMPLSVDSICVHGDSDTAVATTEQIRRELLAAGMTVTGFVQPKR